MYLAIDTNTADGTVNDVYAYEDLEKALDLTIAGLEDSGFFEGEGQIPPDEVRVALTTRGWVEDGEVRTTLFEVPDGNLPEKYRAGR